jgi:hypothetical protein
VCLSVSDNEFVMSFFVYDYLTCFSGSNSIWRVIPDKGSGSLEHEGEQAKHYCWVRLDEYCGDGLRNSC